MRVLALVLFVGFALAASLLAFLRTGDETREHGPMLLLGAAALVAAGGAAALKVGSPLRRKPVDDALDWLRFRIDTFPRRPRLLRLLGPRGLARPGVYHDLPWIGLRQARRAASTRSRWQAMLPLIQDLHVRSALDVGANVGWFCFAFDRLGIPSVAVEANERSVRIGLYARKRLPQPSRVSFLVMEAQPETAQLLPSADCVLFLSVWHHIVRARGLAYATRLVAGLWEKTDRILFFETGENEMPESWGLPALEPDPRTWLAGYLGRTCPDASIIHLGCHDAGIDSCGRPADRNLFAVVRAESA